MEGRALDSGGVEAATPSGDATPALVVTAPEALRGGRFELDKDEQSVGRAGANDIRLADPHVSRRHAWIRIAGSAVIVEDAGSTAGVVVNDVPAAGPTLLHDGDRLRLGAVELELVNGPDRAAAPLDGDPPTAAFTPPPPPAPAPPAPAPPAPAPPASAPPAPSPPAHAAPADAPTPAPTPQFPPPEPERRFDIESQRAHSISNVAGDQYNQYELRIAPMRRRARHLMRLGLVVFIAGLVIFAVGFAAFARPIVECDFNDPNGCLPPDFKGWAVAAVGSFVSAAGLIVIIVSAFMRRKARREEERL